MLTLGCALLSAPAQSQTRAPDVTRELLLLESTERDPLGLDQSTGKELDEAARQLEAARKRAAVASPPEAERGRVLSAIPGVAEVACTQQIVLSQGLSFVTSTLRFESRSSQRAELAYRLPLPKEAAVSKVSVCKRAVCVQAGVGGPRTLREGDGPQVMAERIEDLAGSALALRAASVERGAPLELKVEYVALAEIRGGVARFRLPARGYDARIVDATLSVSATAGLVVKAPEGPVQLEPSRALEVQAALNPAKPRLSHSARARCGGAACSRSFEAGATSTPITRDTWLLLDASPSMEGNARNRADLLLSALLATMPPEAPLRAYAFASRARELGRYTAQAAPLKPLSDALSSELGGASRPATALQLVRADVARARPLVLLVSDAKLDAAALRELQDYREKGAELWLLNVGDQPARAPGFDGVLDVARLAAGAFSSASSEQLEEVLRAPFSPRMSSTLRHGEQQVHEQARPRFVPATRDTWLSFWLSRGTPVSFASDTRALSFIAAPPFVSAARPEPALDTGMPKESVLSMLRSQLVPQARACLRANRKGRANYAVQVTFRALFADREAYDVRVEGKIEEALRSCLLEVVGKLRVPSFSGRIRVRYPIHTEREEELPVVELEPEASEQLERILRGN